MTPFVVRDFYSRQHLVEFHAECTGAQYCGYAKYSFCFVDLKGCPLILEFASKCPRRWPSVVGSSIGGNNSDFAQCRDMPIQLHHLSIFHLGSVGRKLLQLPRKILDEPIRERGSSNLVINDLHDFLMLRACRPIINKILF